jgi:hypothetical protein
MRAAVDVARAIPIGAADIECGKVRASYLERTGFVPIGRGKRRHMAQVPGSVGIQCLASRSAAAEHELRKGTFQASGCQFGGLSKARHIGVNAGFPRVAFGPPLRPMPTVSPARAGPENRQ